MRDLKPLASLAAVLFLSGASAFLPPHHSILSAGLSDRGRWESRIEGDKYNRVYSVYTPDLNWQAMIDYAKTKKWSGPGSSTIVCFFDDWRNTPDVTFTGMGFSDTYKEHWVGGYWYNPNGTELFVQYPARNRISFS